MQLTRTITTIFIVPTLKIPREKLIENQFINGYIKDEQKPDYTNCVFLLFKPKDLNKFKEFLDEEYERTLSIIEDYDYSGGFVVVVYKLDDNFKQDFNLIKLGKYSKTSKDFQELFPKAIKIINEKGLHRDEISLQHKIFRKSKDLIDFWKEKTNSNIEELLGENLEVWEGFDEQREILNIN